jgi:hypothetical protein
MKDDWVTKTSMTKIVPLPPLRMPSRGAAVLWVTLDRCEHIATDDSEVVVKMRVVYEHPASVQPWQQSPAVRGPSPNYELEHFQLLVDDIAAAKLQLAVWDVSRGQNAPDGPGGENTNFLGEVYLNLARIPRDLFDLDIAQQCAVRPSKTFKSSRRLMPGVVCMYLHVETRRRAREIARKGRGLFWSRFIFWKPDYFTLPRKESAKNPHVSVSVGTIDQKGSFVDLWSTQVSGIKMEARLLDSTTPRGAVTRETTLESQARAASQDEDDVVSSQDSASPGQWRSEEARRTTKVGNCSILKQAGGARHVRGTRQVRVKTSEELKRMTAEQKWPLKGSASASREFGVLQESGDGRGTVEAAPHENTPPAGPAEPHLVIQPIVHQVAPATFSDGASHHLGTVSRVLRPNFGTI